MPNAKLEIESDQLHAWESYDLNHESILQAAQVSITLECNFGCIILTGIIVSLCHANEWDGWAHKPGLTHLILVQSPGSSMILCALSIVMVLC